MTTELLDTATDTNAAAQTTESLPTGNTQTQGADGAPATASADTSQATATGDNAAPAAVEYQPFKLPEGIAADEEVLGEFKAEAKRLNMSQEDAQKFADIGIKMQIKQAEAYRKAQEGWIEQSKTDKEFGGEGLQQNLGTAKKALDAFATPELRHLLNTSGLGNHPEVIRHFVRVGKAISEDGRIVTGGKAGVSADPAKRLFPNQI